MIFPLHVVSSLIFAYLISFSLFSHACMYVCVYVNVMCVCVFMAIYCRIVVAVGSNTADCLAGDWTSVAQRSNCNCHFSIN